MNKLLITLLILTGFAFTKVIDPVTIKDFKPATGKWKGTLTYLDYSSGKPFTMPANITVSNDEKNNQQLILAFEYPDEPKANGNDTLVISNDGMLLNNATVVSKEKNQDGQLQIITEEKGKDGNDDKPATLRHIYTISATVFSSRKEVKFDDGDKYILRNEYKMSR